MAAMAPNLMRPDTPPVMIATVMMANAHWKATKTMSGRPSTKLPSATVSVPFKNSWPKPPMIWPSQPSSGENCPSKAVENVTATHRTAVIPMARKLIIMVLPTFFLRLRPP